MGHSSARDATVVTGFWQVSPLTVEGAASPMRTEFTRGWNTLKIGSHQKSLQSMLQNRLASLQVCLIALLRFSIILSTGILGWGEWGQWSDCSGECSGTQTRSRQCLNGIPGIPGCEGEDTESRVCTLQNQRNWSTWSDCSLTCGGGQQTRTRNCMGPDLKTRTQRRVCLTNSYCECVYWPR